MVEEGTVSVDGFSDVVADISPRAARVWRRGRLQVLVDNRSNISFDAELCGTDAEDAFGFRFAPPLLQVGPGSVASAKVTVRPRQLYWRGPSSARPFQVLLRQPQRTNGDPTAPEPAPHPANIAAEGTIVRDAVLPMWLPKAVGLLVVLVLLAGLFWFKLVKPQIAAAAQNQVTQAVKPIKRAIQHLESTSTTAALPATTTTTPSTGIPHPTTTTTTTTASTHRRAKRSKPAKRTVVVASPVNYSLLTKGNNTTATYTVPRGDILSVTDFLLENSAGASGNIALIRNGNVLMSWSLANFRDLDYHWITPIYFDSDAKLELSVTGCQGICRPALYYAGTLTSYRTTR